MLLQSPFNNKFLIGSYNLLNKISIPSIPCAPSIPMECFWTLAWQIFIDFFIPLFKKCRYQKAVQWFELTLDHTSSSLNEMWEPTLVNLGHALRKLK
jgi:hypothetical protein